MWFVVSPVDGSCYTRYCCATMAKLTIEHRVYLGKDDKGNDKWGDPLAPDTVVEYHESGVVKSTGNASKLTIAVDGKSQVTEFIPPRAIKVMYPDPPSMAYSLL